MSEVAQAAAVRAALEAPLGAWSAYDYDDLPATLPNLYALVTVSRRFGVLARFCAGQPQARGWRLTTMGVGRTVDEARWVLDRVAEGIEGQALTVDGRTSTRVRFESQQPVEEDEGRYSGTITWTYVL